MRIIRVFPRKTSATPDDEMVRINTTPDLFDEADRVEISVAFTWDLPRVDELEKQWRHVAPVSIGGPATGEAGGDFVAGKYLKNGYVITSRGCPNNCWFCSVWKREGQIIRELPIVEGWNILDDNLLACSDDHIKKVFAMLKSQKMRKPEMTGGLEAKKLQQWHVDQLVEVKPKQMFFAYDTPDDLEPLIEAGKMLINAGFTVGKRVLRAYVLCGYPHDTFEKAEKRMKETISAGFMPMAMLYRNAKGERKQEWMRWQRQWARPAIIAQHMKVAA